MKKLTTLFILLLLALGLFAEPNVPKTYKGEDSYSYISHDFKYSYEINSGKVNTPNFSYAIYFIKTSLESDRRITLIIYFVNETQLDNFTKKIKLEDIEDEFTRIQKSMIKNGSKPNELFKQEFDPSNPPKNIVYYTDGTKLK